MDATTLQLEAGTPGAGPRTSRDPAAPARARQRSAASAAVQRIFALMPAPLPTSTFGLLRLLPLRGAKSKHSPPECKAPVNVEQGMARNRLVGINHVALEVGDVEEALAFYGKFFEFTLRGRAPGAAFIDIGDQFLALMEGPTGPADRARHFGLVVEDKEAAREALEAAGIEIRPGRRLDFQDPWGNTVEVVSTTRCSSRRATGS